MGAGTQQRGNRALASRSDLFATHLSCDLSLLSLIQSEGEGQVYRERTVMQTNKTKESYIHRGSVFPLKTFFQQWLCCVCIHDRAGPVFHMVIA